MTKPADVVCDGDVCRRVTPEEAAAQSSVPDGALKLLGDTLLGKDGSKVSVSSITGPGKVIGLYFSAHWCPPCRGFTPKLAKAYSAFKQSHARKADWEVVFVSSDRDEAAFNGYFEEMPWLALPFENRDAKAALSKAFKVRGIPTLVILDGETGELITASGRDAIADDEQCDNFPWKPRPVSEILSGELLGPKDSKHDAASAIAGKVTMLYFSAHWCPPCRRFTPKLVESYNKLRAAGKAVEVVFISGDRDEPSFKEYFGQMPWLAIPFADTKRKDELNMRFEVDGIPTLIVLDEQLNVITQEGTGAVAADPECEAFPWRPQPLEPLSQANVSRINNTKVLMLVASTQDKAAAKQQGESLLRDLAVSTKAGPGGDDWTFFHAMRRDDLTANVLQFLGVLPAPPEGEGKAEAAPATQGPQGDLLLLVDIQSQRVWDLTAAAGGDQLTASGVAAAFSDFKAGKAGPGSKIGGEDEDDDE